MRAKRSKNLKFYVEVLKKKRKDLLVWTVVKIGVIVCKIYIKMRVIMQADDIGRPM